jgi:hypothetical protein
MTSTGGRTWPEGCLFEVPAGRPVTAADLQSAGLPWQPLAAVWLGLARVKRTGRWHLAPGGATGTMVTCPRLRQAVRRNRALEQRDVGLLDGMALCGWCAARLAVPGPAGAYVALARQILAAAEWVAALEAAPLPADWLDYARWNARTPFAEPGPVSALIGELPASEPWAACRAAAEATWDRLHQRAEAGWKRVRHAAGPPGFRAVAACACAFVGASPETQHESHLLTAVSAGQLERGASSPDPWTGAGAAWLDAVAQDADVLAAGRALHAALEELLASAPVRDVSLLPAPMEAPVWEHASPAQQARAEYQALLHQVADRWCQRLAGTLAALLDEADDGWLLLRIAGWPLTDDQDQELAYLASYPELGRIPDPGCGLECDRNHRSWVVVLHVPGFAALHAAVHDSAHLDVTAGTSVPAGAHPSPAQVHELLRPGSQPGQDPAGEGAHPGHRA